MKKILLIILFHPLLLFCQIEQDRFVDGKSMLPMSDTYQRPSTIYGNQYFQEGSDKPYTGYLFGKFDNGQLMTLQEYKNGIGEGIWIQFNPDGSKLEQGTYVANRVEGPVTQFWEDGTIKARGYYRHWKQPIGEWTYYDRKGKEVHKMVYTR